jgi:murein DD-endopeptidase MepM/ murein hydrolase activator NlpD
VFDVAVVPYPREVSVEAASAEITPEHPSLIGAFDAVGESIQLPLAVSEIFNGEIDFNTELQRGDQARVLFERVRREGQPAGYGDVEAAVLEHSGRQFVAVPFPMADGKIAWYDETGRSLKRQFLKSPLPFDPRVTSGFSTNRLHPIFHRVRAHLGVDYAAGIGTAVIAIADGVVESAEWAGEAGRMVVVRHSGGYESMYLHLSSFAVRPGTHVSQGQLLGRVGMSGAATGPHLDFRIKRNGVHLNPLTFRSGMPTGEPIAPNQLAAFQEARDRALAKLRELAAPSLVTTARPASRP